MTKKEYEVKQELLSLIDLRSKIEYLVSKLEMMRELATIVNPKKSEVKIQKSKNPHKFEEDVIKIIEYEEKVKRKVKTYMDKIDETEAFIDLLKDVKCQKVLKDRYILGLKFEEIANNNSYEISNIFKLHKKGIRELAKIKCP